MSSDPKNRIRPSLAHAFGGFDESRYVGCRVVRGDPIGLVAEKILTILITHTGGTKPMPERVPKIVNSNHLQPGSLPCEFLSPIVNALRRVATVGEDELGVYSTLII